VSLRARTFRARTRSESAARGRIARRETVENLLLAFGLGILGFVGCSSQESSEARATTATGTSTTAATTTSDAAVTTTGAAMTGPCAGDAPDGTCEVQNEDCNCPDCTGTAVCIPDQCVTDGVCTLDDACVCPDCDEDSQCGCNADGTCDSLSEWCRCIDCWEHPECADNTHSKCKDDGLCDVYDFCTCSDCLRDVFCLDPASCTDDGDCGYDEGCQCTDCAVEPLCAGGVGAGGN